jgi:hypothetical protein
MKNLFLAAVVAFAIFSLGCGQSPSTERRMETKNNYSVIVIDGCEYIECDYGILAQRVYSLTHKGNCKNPVHIHNR